MKILEFEFYLETLLEGYEYDRIHREWTKLSGDRKLRIFTDIKDNTPHSIRWNGISGGIFFNAVENIMMRVYKDYKFNHSYFENTINLIIPANVSFDHSIFNFQMERNEHFSIVGKEMQYLVRNGAEPFFDRFKTLEDVANVYSTLKPDKASKYIQGMSLFMRVILVLRETNHPSFLAKRDEYHEVLSNYVITDQSEIPLLKLFEKTFY